MDRRDFLRNASAVGTASGAFAARPAAKSAGRVLGANDRINVGVVGVGGRGSYVANVFAKVGADTNKCQIVKVCDTYQKRVNVNMDRHKCKGTLDWREVVSDKDVDAVIVATPDHWHATVALEAMNNGKDVYLEKPMCHTVDEVKQLIEAVKETKRIIQVGSQTTSGDQWHQAKKYIADGAIGKMLLSQGSSHRNSVEGE
jgi:predicted dehydrogenase